MHLILILDVSNHYCGVTLFLPCFEKKSIYISVIVRFAVVRRSICSVNLLIFQLETAVSSHLYHELSTKLPLLAFHLTVLSCELTATLSPLSVPSLLITLPSSHRLQRQGWPFLAIGPRLLLDDALKWRGSSSGTSSSMETCNFGHL